MEQVGRVLEASWEGWLAAMRVEDLSPLVDGRIGPAAAAVVAFLACVSTLLGRSVVLVVNRMRRGGFLFALAVNLITLVWSYVVLGVALWAIGRLWLGSQVSAVAVPATVLWGCAPLILGFLTAVPVLGTGFDRVLSVWSALIVWRIVGGLYEVDPWRAGALTVASWLAMWVMTWVLAHPLARLRDWTWRRMTGRPLYDSARWLLDQAAVDGSIADLDGPDELIAGPSAPERRS